MAKHDGAAAGVSVTPKRAWGRAAAKRAIVAAMAFLAVGVLLFGGWLRSWREARRLTEKDTIVHADFANMTGDTVLDGALRQGLSVQLEQSPFLSLLSDGRIAQTLAFMAQPPDAQFTPVLRARGLPADCKCGEH